MIIEDCKHCEHYVTDACGDKVCAFDGDCENYVQTNEEYMRSCNTEQLADVLFSWYKLGRLDAINKHTEIKKDWLIEHLKQPHTEKE